MPIEKPMTLMAAVREVFFTKGDGTTDFAAMKPEYAALSPEDKVSLANDFRAEGWEITDYTA